MYVYMYINVYFKEITTSITLYNSLFLYLNFLIDLLCICAHACRIIIDNNLFEIDIY